MKAVLAAVIATTALVSMSTAAHAHSMHHGHKVCVTHHHHRVCSWR